MCRLLLFLFFLLAGLAAMVPSARGQAPASVADVPSVYTNIAPSEEGVLQITTADGVVLQEVGLPPSLTLQEAIGDPQGTETGIAFTFPESLGGILYYGFIPYGDSQHPHPVYFRSIARIRNGRAEIPIRGNLEGRYDMIGWQDAGRGTLGYRIVDSTGLFVYDGIVNFTVNERSGAFEVAPTIIEGPLVNQVRPDGALIRFTTNDERRCQVVVDGKTFRGNNGAIQEIRVDGLQPDRSYDYTVLMRGDTLARYRFRTAPEPGSRKPFTFAYASDSRSGQGGGERDLYGTNAYIMKKILALATREHAAFMQFSGDLINGYLTSQQETDLQYANWKRAVQPWWHYMPIYVAMGNHEALVRLFANPENPAQQVSVNRWPFDADSAESTFADNFAMPENGPDSEDGAAFDPSANEVDFPSYKENVFYYTYDNVAIVVLNSDYLYAPTTAAVRITGGNIHGYILDRQMEWMRNTLQDLDTDPDIDHVFVTLHTPAFPNGGHVADDMWYNGNNQFRPYIAGKPLPKGIIERRDELLDIMINQSEKVRALLTGDEHNYARLPLGPDTPMYPETYFFPRIELTRSIWQINNGAAGAPYYAQEQTPWSDLVVNFTTQNALVLIHVDGEQVDVEVLNPDTLEQVDQFTLQD